MTWPLPFKLPSLPVIGLAILAVLLSVQTVRIEGLSVWPAHITGLKGQLAHTKQDLADTQHAFTATVENYRTAAKQRALADQANADRVKAEQAAINERTQNEYEARLADARARADRLRAQLEAGAHPGSPAAAGVSGANAAPGRPVAAAPQDGFSVSDRLISTEQAIQLDELIKWVKANVKVDYSGSSQSSQNASR